MKSFCAIVRGRPTTRWNRWD